MDPFRIMAMVNSATGGGGYSETTFIGVDPASSPPFNYGLDSDYKSVIAITVPSGGVWVKKFGIHLVQAFSGNKIKPVLYSGVSSGSTLVKAGQELSTGALGDTLFLGDWNADGSAFFIAAGSYGLGCITLADAARAVAGTTYWNADTYSDGPSDPFGAVSSSGVQMICWCPASVSGP